MRETLTACGGSHFLTALWRAFETIGGIVFVVFLALVAWMGAHMPASERYQSTARHQEGA